MSSGGGLAKTLDRDELIRCAGIYDTTVGIVSAFHWLFTEQEVLAPTVRHFERYPDVAHPDGKRATPEFTVLFEDGAALVGEIANLTLRPEGVDSLCHQLLRYDRFTEIPGVGGTKVQPTSLDVLYFVNVGNGTAAVNQIIRTRMRDPDHFYKPSLPPCIITATPVASGYVFERQGDADNGVIREEGREGIGNWLTVNSINAKAGYFSANKATWAFANDPIDPLYLATHLWTHEFATRAGSKPKTARIVNLPIGTSALAAELKAKYGKGSKSEVERAMELLARGKFATRVDSANWEVAWGEFLQADDDLQSAIARRAASPPKEGTLGRLRHAQREEKRTTTAPTLF